jgi:Mce-associated membrane protein
MPAPEASVPETANSAASSPAADSEDLPAAEAEVTGAGRAQVSLRRQLISLIVATVILAGLAAGAAIQTHNLRASQPAVNLALTDRALTAQVRTQVSATVGTIFSYSYANPAATRQAAQRLLTGPAIRQYNQLFALVEQKAPAEKLVLSTKVTDLGVELLAADRARLLVFVNQQDRAGSGQAVYSGAMFAVTAVRRHGHWLVEDINTFTTSS